MSNSGKRRSASVRWVSGLTDSATPVFLLDARRRLLVFNQGCAQWTGWNADDVLGEICDYVTEADSHSVDAVLSACAPPAEVWQGESADVPFFIPHRTESPRAGRIRFQPLLDADRKVVQVWGQFLPPQEPSLAASSTPAQLLHAELAALRQQVRRRYGEESVVADSAQMRRVLAQLAVARLSSDCVLFTGEPGVGREHLARVLHHHGSRTKQAFVPIDCRRSTSAELKRLLKHVRDDQTELETLRTGTLFLREVDATSADVQERLVELLAETSNSPSPRVMAATSEPLIDLVEQDRLLRDLYYRLTTLVIDVPPLAQRPDDILPLAQFFLEECNRHVDRQLSGFNPEALDALRRYRWPGHVAELRTTVETAAQQATGPLLAPADFPLSFRAGQDAQQLGPAATPRIEPLETVLEELERTHIQAALAASRENLSKAAELLGLSRPKLYRRLEALGLLPENPAEK